MDIYIYWLARFLNYLLMTTSMSCIFRWHDCDEIYQLFKTIMCEAKKFVQIRACLTIIIIQTRPKLFQLVHLLSKEFLILILKLLKNIIIVEKFLYRAVRLAE